MWTAHDICASNVNSTAMAMTYIRMTWHTYAQLTIHARTATPCPQMTQFRITISSNIQENIWKWPDIHTPYWHDMHAAARYRAGHVSRACSFDVGARKGLRSQGMLNDAHSMYVCIPGYQAFEDVRLRESLAVCIYACKHTYTHKCMHTHVAHT